jgi:hypothetical protein
MFEQLSRLLILASDIQDDSLNGADKAVMRWLRLLMKIANGLE